MHNEPEFSEHQNCDLISVGILIGIFSLLKVMKNLLSGLGQNPSVNPEVDSIATPALESL